MRRALHNSENPAAHVSRSLAETDPTVREALDNETRRQRTQVELIASENVMSRAVREALGHEIGNKTLEGYPGNRFPGGGEYVDVVERLVLATALKCAYSLKSTGRCPLDVELGTWGRDASSRSAAPTLRPFG